jgi:hypothetical protein
MVSITNLKMKRKKRLKKSRIRMMRRGRRKMV